jgi:hypothetical protein
VEQANRNGTPAPSGMPARIPGGGSTGAAESGGESDITGGAGGNLSGGPDVDAALAEARGGKTAGTNATSVGLDDESGPRTRVIGGSVAHPYGVDPTGTQGEGAGNPD